MGTEVSKHRLIQAYMLYHSVREFRYDSSLNTPKETRMNGNFFKDHKIYFRQISEIGNVNQESFKKVSGSRVV